MDINYWAAKDVAHASIDSTLMSYNVAMENGKSHFVVRVSDKSCFICNKYGVVNGPLTYHVAQKELQNYE